MKPRILLPVLLIAALLGAGGWWVFASGDDEAAPRPTPGLAGPASSTTATTSRPPVGDGVVAAPPGSTAPQVTPTTSDEVAPVEPPEERGTPSSTVAPSNPPVIAIVEPASLRRYQATFSAAEGRFGASVSLVAEVVDPDGDPVTVEWFSSDEGFLGAGTAITARLHPQGDASQPVITAVATDDTGASASASRQVIVWIPSDQ